MANIVKLSQACSLALHSIAIIAAKTDGPTSTQFLAEKFGASSNHLSKVLQRLAKAGFIRNIRGPKGGTTLAKGPDAITLLEIYESIEGPFEFKCCLLKVPHCQGCDCMLGGFIEEANRKIYQELSNTTLHQLVERVQMSQYEQAV